MIRDRGKIKEKWGEYFEELLKETQDHKQFKEPMVHGPIGKISTKEVKHRLARMRKGKACGQDDISREKLLLMEELGVEQLTKKLNDESKKERQKSGGTA